MPRLEIVGVIHQTFCSGSRGEGRIEFGCCVDSRYPQIHELWGFANDGVTREVHPFDRVDVGDFSGDCFQTYYMNEKARRVTIFDRISINAIVEWIGTPIPFYDTAGVPWIDNILVPELYWGDGDRYKHWALET